MPHIHTEAGQIDHTVTAYIARTDGDEPKLLFHMHKKHKRLLPVGGHVELDETPWAALAHEIREEAGYDIDQLQVMQPKLRIEEEAGVVHHPQPLRMNTHHVSDGHYHSDTAYLLLAGTEPKYLVDRGESTDLRWLSRSEIAKLSQDVVFLDAQQAALQIFDKFLPAWEAVPSADFSLSKDWQNG